mgnify:CR=1 FL=1|jgi:hypothetical protein
MKGKLWVYLFVFFIFASGGYAYCNETITMIGDLSTAYNQTIVKDCTPEHDIGGTPIAAIILVPMLLAFILLGGSATLKGEEHAALKISLFLLSIIPFSTSLHLGITTLGRYYEFEALQNYSASLTYWFGLVFGVIVSYFLIYLFYKIVHAWGQNKKEKLEY